MRLQAGLCTMPIYACSICKRPLWKKTLCDVCGEDLWHHLNPVTRTLGRYQAQSLFPWERDGWPALRWWISALKRKDNPLFWQEASLWALQKFGPYETDPVIVPIPSASGAGQGNHALGFARALSKWTGWKVENEVLATDLIASKHPLTYQKKLGRQARQRKRFIGPPCKISRPVLIVDDIITTGATVRAAIKALHRPESARVWCLMDRRPCGSMTPLL